jgi:asparagine synthase (glutamine-hydrolysing)
MARLQTESYWDVEYDVNVPQGSVPATLDEMILDVRARISDAVRSRLRSDVPLAVLLSGGLDSCSIAGVAAHLLKESDPSARLNTFTLSFPGEKSSSGRNKSLTMNRAT